MDKVLVMGIGNLLLTDDGVGVHAAQTLAGESWPENVTIMEAGTFTQDVFYLFCQLRGHSVQRVFCVFFALHAYGFTELRINCHGKNRKKQNGRD